MPRGDVKLWLAPPQQGIKTDAPTHLVPDGYMTAGVNMLPRDPGLMVRSGYSRLTINNDPFTDAGIGGVSFIDNFLVQRIFAISKTKIAEYNPVTQAWADRSDAVLAGSDDDRAQTAVFQTSTETVVIMTNNVDIPRKLVAGSTATLIAGGAPAKAVDVTVSFQRVIFGNVEINGLRAPSSLLISDKDDPGTYAATSRVDLTDTNDTIVAVKALNNQVFAIYKDQSQWIGVGSPTVYPFTFELRSQAPGPVSPSAVVQAGDNHYYIGQDGNVYVFDGHTAKSIGDNVWLTLQSDINFSKSRRIHGYYDRTWGEIWWFYCSNAIEATHPDAGIVYSLSSQTFSTPLRFSNQLSCSFDFKNTTQITWDDLDAYTWDTLETVYPNWDSFTINLKSLSIIMSSIGRPYIFGVGELDDGATFEASFTLPIRDYTGPGEMVYCDAVESFWRTTDTQRVVDLQLVTSHILGNDGDLSPKKSFNLNRGERMLSKYENTNVRFLGIKQTLPHARGNESFQGAVLYLNKRGVA